MRPRAWDWRSLHFFECLWEQFSEVAAAATSTSRFRFSAPSLSPSPKALPIIAQMEALSCAPSSLRSEELALRIIARVIALMASDRQTPAAPTGRETRRVIEAIRLVESDATRALELKEMAAVAGMSKYHFLRVFRRLTGVTPHRYLISARLRRAALALASSRRPVIAVALDAGFGDLSTFNKTFRAVFGLTPTQYRDLRR
jgi:AraC-like DNA-binding protein